MEKRTVIIPEVAVKRAECFRGQKAAKTGIRISIGAVFAEALDVMLRNSAK